MCPRSAAKREGSRFYINDGGSAMSVVTGLTDLRNRSGHDFGGKASMLSAMLAEGVRVLPGVAVSAEAYDAALRATGASALAQRFWGTPWSQAGPTDRHERLASRIASLLEGSEAAEIAEHLSRSVLGRLSDLSVTDSHLIVRSSATGEDSHRMSYAGQFMSVPSRAHPQSLSRALAAVWASCTSPHVAAYRAAVAARNPDAQVQAPPMMGVVVQPYRRFQLAGLLFSQHPTVAINGWMLLEYLDEEPSRLVAGEVLPHRCRVSLNTLTTLWERRIPDRPVLPHDILKDLVAGATRLRSLVGAEVDIEWGANSDGPYFLQCRPATTSPDDA